MIEGQLNSEERALLSRAVLEVAPEVALEVGTWKGGGSTLHILQALEANGRGHLWGVEASREIYDEMLQNIKVAGGAAAARFTPLFCLSQEVIPAWLRERGDGAPIGFVFLDGGNNPMEQITEFHLLEPHMPVGSILMSHDANLRKGKWLVPYMSELDNWDCQVHDISVEGFHAARKTATSPSPDSLKRARRKLRGLRLKPLELVSSLLPGSLRTWLAYTLPRKLARRLSEGR